MVVLKKIKASTLVETITATVIIISVFSIALLTLNNVFASTIKNDKSKINNHLLKLEYQYKNKNLVIPYNEDFENWELSIYLTEEDRVHWVVFKAVNKTTMSVVKKKLIDAKEY